MIIFVLVHVLIISVKSDSYLIITHSSLEINILSR